MNESTIDPSSSPGAAFGVQLRRSRKAVGLSQAQLGARIFCTGTYVSYIERAKRPVSHNFAIRADEALNTGGTLELMWWSLGNAALMEGFPEYAELEAKATKIRNFEQAVVTGLLQTPEYAAALASAGVRRGSITQDLADERVAFVLARQRRLERPTPPMVHAVLDEGCLRRLRGSRKVMATQLLHLEELAERPNVVIQIAPFDLGDRIPFRVPMSMLTLPDRRVLGYSESLERGHLERESDTVARWERNYDHLQVEALSQAASVEMIRAVRKELFS